MLSKVFRGIGSFIFWTYERGSWQYDLMSALILAFIFLTPRQFFHDRPVPTEARQVMELPAALLFPWLSETAVAADTNSSSRNSYRLAAEEGTPGPAPTLKQVLAAMDAAAARFRSAVAEVTYTKVTLLVDDKSIEEGTVYFKRHRRNRDFKVLIHFREPAEKIVLFRDGKGWIYRPAIARVEEYDVSRNREAVEQFLLLGFGIPVRQLQEAYHVALAGPGSSQAGDQKTLKLELVPRSAATRRHIRKVELWLSRDTWQPVRQHFIEPSGDYMIVEFTGTKLNTAIPNSRFKLKLRGKVKKIRPQSL